LLLPDSKTFEIEKQKSPTFKKSPKIFNLLMLNSESEKEEAKKEWKNESSLNANNSTLSLHISAYENSVETIASDSFKDKNNDSLEKDPKQILASASSTFIIQDTFEFPRQQNDDDTTEFGLSQYKASQRLLNPNDSSDNMSSAALNRTFTKDDEPPTTTKSALNRTFTKDDEEDRTKTMVLSKNKARPGLPDAMTTNTIGTMESDENNPHQQQSFKNLRERHHVRRSTVTVNENPIGSEIAQLLNEVSASNPEDVMVAVQRRMTHFLTDKEKQWKEEAAKNQRKAAAVLEIKLAKAQASSSLSNAAATIKTPLSGPGRSLSPDQSIEQISLERDQYRDQAMMHVKTLGELIKQHEVFMDKEKFYQESVSRFHEEQQIAANTIAALHERFQALQAEAEQRIKEANEEIEQLHKQHDDDTVSLRFKHRQQELKIKSLESQIDTLKIERKELLDMCDDLVARSERASDKNNATITAADY
jgi:hypothetical protein